MKRLFAIAMLLATQACAHGSTAASARASAAAAANNPASSSDGATVYVVNCSSCHGVDGRGIEGMIPPLARNADVTGDPHRVIAVVAGGLQGRLAVGGVTYDGDMPGWDGELSDDQIASVVTYIRSAWGNRAPAVTLREIEATR